VHRNPPFCFNEITPVVCFPLAQILAGRIFLINQEKTKKEGTSLRLLSDRIHNLNIASHVKEG